MHPIASGFGPFLRRLRQERSLAQRELAVRAEISLKHVSCLERGDAQPTREMCLLLANALELSIELRNTLVQAAGFHPAYGTTDLEAERLRDLRGSVQQLVTAMAPIPVLAYATDWQLIAINEPCIRLLRAMLGEPVFSELAKSGQKALLASRELESRIVNLPDLRAKAIGRLIRDAWIQGPSSPAAVLAAEMLALFPQMDVGETAPVPLCDIEAVIDGDRLHWAMVLSTIGTRHDFTYEGVRLETFFPKDEFTRSWMAKVGVPV